MLETYPPTPGTKGKETNVFLSGGDLWDCLPQGCSGSAPPSAEGRGGLVRMGLQVRNKRYIPLTYFETNEVNFWIPYRLFCNFSTGLSEYISKFVVSNCKKFTDFHSPPHHLANCLLHYDFLKMFFILACGEETHCLPDLTRQHHTFLSITL